MRFDSREIERKRDREKEADHYLLYHLLFDAVHFSRISVFSLFPFLDFDFDFGPNFYFISVISLSFSLSQSSLHTLYAFVIYLYLPYMSSFESLFCFVVKLNQFCCSSDCSCLMCLFFSVF